MTDRLDQVAIFVAVAEHGSFAEAARRLNRAPAAVTRAVAALEDQHRTRLLNRTTRSVSLTDAGVRYLDVGRRLLAAYDELHGLDDVERNGPHGVIGVTAPAHFGRLHVLPALAGFLGRYRQVDVRALLIDRIVSLVDEGLDVGVRLGNLPDSSLRAVRTGQTRLGVYASPDYLARHGTPRAPSELGDHAVISCTAVTPVPERWAMDGIGSTGHVAVHPRLTVSTTDAAADAAADGIGLVYQMCYQVRAHIDAGRLVRVLADLPAPAIPIHVIHPAGRFLPGKVRLLIDHLADSLRAKFADN